MATRKQIKHRGEVNVVKHLRVPVSPGQEAAIKARAAEMNLTAADYLRSVAQADIELHGMTTPWPEARRFYHGRDETDVSEEVSCGE